MIKNKKVITQIQSQTSRLQIKSDWNIRIKEGDNHVYLYCQDGRIWRWVDDGKFEKENLKIDMTDKEVYEILKIEIAETDADKPKDITKQVTGSDDIIYGYEAKYLLYTIYRGTDADLKIIITDLAPEVIKKLLAELKINHNSVHYSECDDAKYEGTAEDNYGNRAKIEWDIIRANPGECKDKSEMCDWKNPSMISIIKRAY